MTEPSNQGPASSQADCQHSDWEPPSVEHLQSLLPQFEIDSMVGYGGMGAIYKGRQKSLDRIVAIKILRPPVGSENMSFIERFHIEARLMARLMHPNIVGVFDSGETREGQGYLVMEYVDGTNLEQIIETSGRMAPVEALQVTSHVCDALDHAHHHGVTHRDIKPANILITHQGQVKVADFGIAWINGPEPIKRLTAVGMAIGTPDYVAPETLSMSADLDGRADLYAVGVMLYKMLTGTVPRGIFLMPSVCTDGVDPRFDAIILKAMQADRELRYQCASEIRCDLDIIAATPWLGRPALTSSPMPLPALPGTSERRFAQPDNTAGNDEMLPASALPPAVDDRLSNGVPGSRKRGQDRANKFESVSLGIIGACVASLIVAFPALLQLRRATGPEVKSGGSIETSSVGVSDPPAANGLTLPAAGWRPIANAGPAVLSLPTNGWCRHPAAMVSGSFRDVAVRARLRFVDNGAAILTLRGRKSGKQLEAYAAEIDQSRGIRLLKVVVGPDGGMDQRAFKVLGSWPLPAPVPLLGEFELAFAIAGSQLAVWFNHYPVVIAQDNSFPGGFISVNAAGSSVEFKDVEWCYLTAFPEAGAPAPAAAPAPGFNSGTLLEQYMRAVAIAHSRAATVDRLAFEDEMARVQTNAALPEVAADSHLPAELKRLRGGLREQLARSR